jgi:Protein of unknown function (DUF2867)
MPTRSDLPELCDLLPTADVVDVKTATGSVTLREFIAGTLGYSPVWLKALFGVRMLLATALRLRTAGIPPTRKVRPDTVSFAPGDLQSFFTVIRGEEHHYVLLGIDDNHLNAHLAIIVTDDHLPVREFTVVTLVHYHRAAGRLYYGVIRPFHHLVITAMIRSGLSSQV